MKAGLSETTGAMTGAARTIAYRGAPIHLHGPADDQYFQSVRLDPEGDAGLYWIGENLLTRQSAVLDIGANIGVTASVFARHTKGPIWALEPSPVVFPHLQATLTANGADQVRARNIALGRTKGTLQFYADQTAAAASHLITQNTLARQSDLEVTVSTLNGFVADEQIETLDLVKLDVEGFELEVLAGGADALLALKPALYLEFNPFTLIAFGNINPRDLLNSLRLLFPYIYRFRRGLPHQIRTDQHVIDFLHSVMIGAGCVDDLLCTFSPVAGGIRS